MHAQAAGFKEINIWLLCANFAFPDCEHGLTFPMSVALLIENTHLALLAPPPTLGALHTVSYARVRNTGTGCTGNKNTKT